MLQITDITPGSKTGSYRSWREVLPIHPAAELFPLMSPDELKELGEDIAKNGLRTPITVTHERAGDKWCYQLLDGRNRLDAIALAGFDAITPKRSRGYAARCREGEECGLDILLGLPYQLEAAIKFVPDDDSYALAASLNIRRRHLTAEQKRDLIAKLIKATPRKSNRQIAETVKASPTTVGTVRAEMEASGDVSKLDTRQDSKGRQQPARKPPPKPPAAAAIATAMPGDIGPMIPAAPNPIADAWIDATHEQRAEFAKNHGDAVADRLVHESSGPDNPRRYQLWEIAEHLDGVIKDHADDLADEYDSIIAELRELRDRIDDADDDDDDDADAEDDDGLGIPTFLRRAAS